MCCSRLSCVDCRYICEITTSDAIFDIEIDTHKCVLSVRFSHFCYRFLVRAPLFRRIFLSLLAFDNCICGCFCRSTGWLRATPENRLCLTNLEEKVAWDENHRRHTLTDHTKCPSMSNVWIWMCIDYVQAGLMHLLPTEIQFQTHRVPTIEPNRTAKYCNELIYIWI